MEQLTTARNLLTRLSSKPDSIDVHECITVLSTLIDALSSGLQRTDNASASEVSPIMQDMKNRIKGKIMMSMHGIEKAMALDQLQHTSDQTKLIEMQAQIDETFARHFQEPTKVTASGLSFVNVSNFKTGA